MKKSHRIIRDVSLVVVFCAGFLTLIWFANSLQDSPQEETNSEFSRYRVEADEAIQNRNLDASLANLRSLVAKDPYDGRAQYRLAETLFSKTIELQTATAKPSTDETSASGGGESSVDQHQQRPPTAATSPQNSSSTSPLATDSWRLMVDQTIREYQLAEKHVRYRLRSQFQLALLWSLKGDYEAALGSLEKFVAGGGVTRSGLDQIEQFGVSSYPFEATKLHADPRFFDLVNSEFENRIRRSNYRGFENSSQPRRSFERRRQGWSFDQQNPFPTVA